MGNKDLILVASRIRNVTRCRNTLGEPGVFGVRVQPNHPTDDLGGILLAALDGLLYGCGDAVIGVNPAAESVRFGRRDPSRPDRLIDVLGAPTQACCLRTSRRNSPPWTAARRSICCFNRSRARKPPTPASAFRWRCCAKDATIAGASQDAFEAWVGEQCHVF